MASSNFIIKKVQDAMTNYMVSREFDWEPSCVSGLSRGPNQDDTDSEERSTDANRIVSNCQSAHWQGGLYSGVWICNVTVTLSSNADDTTEGEHLERTGICFDEAMDNNKLQQGVNAFPDFTCFFVNRTDQNYLLTGRRWESVITLEMHCAGVGAGGALPPPVGTYDWGFVNEPSENTFDFN